MGFEASEILDVTDAQPAACCRCEELRRGHPRQLMASPTSLVTIFAAFCGLLLLYTFALGIFYEDEAEFRVEDLVSVEPSLAELYPGGFLAGSAPGCSDQVTMTVVVFTAPPNRERRQAIRDGWGRDVVGDNTTRLVFLVGVAGLKEGDIQGLRDEQDVVLANFRDGYTNLTLKSVSMLDWAWQNCPRVDYLLKSDDDVYVNLPLLRKRLKSTVLPGRSIVGRVGHLWKPVRNDKSKYFLSRAQFRQEVLPDFATGPAYLISGPLVAPLLKAALEEPWIGLEDVFLTGVVGVHRLGAALVNWPEFYNERLPPSGCNARKIAIHDVRPKEQLRFVKARDKSCPRLIRDPDYNSSIM